MKSKELIEILNKTRRTPNISLTPEQVEEIIKDLERLDIIENHFNVEVSKQEYNLEDVSNYFITLREKKFDASLDSEIVEEEFNKLKEIIKNDITI